MTPARVRACSRLARRAMKPGASPSCRSNTLRFTTMIVSIVVAGDWADSRTGDPVARSAPAAPGRVDGQARGGARGILRDRDPSVPLPASGRLRPQRVTPAGDVVAREVEQRQCRQAETSRDGVAQKRRAEA